MYILKIEPNDKILVVAPHPDDESIGCGGLISRYGKQTDILVVTNGCKAHDDKCTDMECANIRYNELQRALKIASAHNIIVLNVEDGKAYSSYTKLKTVDWKSYTKIFIPNSNEEHVDHRAVNRIVKRLFYFKHFNAKMYEYEVWTMMPYANVFFDISEVYEIKKRMVLEYGSQIKIRNYEAMIEGMSLYRGVLNHVSRAECFQTVDIKSKLKKIYFMLPFIVQNWLKSK